MPDAAWTAIRCGSATCDTPGGRVLYRQHPDGWVALVRRRQAIIARANLALVVCRCGWIWRNPDLTTVPDLATAFRDDPLRAGA